MRDVVVLMGISIDGYVSGGPEEDVGKGEPEHAEVVARKMAWVSKAGVHAKGRVTYKEMSGFWPTSTAEYRPVAPGAAVSRCSTTFLRGGGSSCGGHAVPRRDRRLDLPAAVMALVRCDMTVSLDGFVAGLHDGVDEPMGVGGFRLFNWLDRRHDPDENGQVFSEAMATRAVVADRRTYENAGRWNGDHLDGVPIFVLTHDVPDDPPPGSVRYLTDVRECARAARAAAGDGHVVAMGAGAAQALLAAGELDELELHVVPVLLCRGRRLFDLSADQCELELLRCLTPDAGNRLNSRSPTCATASCIEHGLTSDLPTTGKLGTMATVICDMSVSLDGYVTGPNDSRENPFGDGAHTLHDWLSDATTDADRALLSDYIDGTGAIVMGRRSFDKNEGDGGWGEAGPLGDTPCFVVTHSPPERQYPPVFTFVTDGVESAIARAKEVAGDKAVGLHGATVMQQALPLGLVDEFRLHVIPVLVGGGTPLFAGLDDAISLQRTAVVATPAATHLNFSV